MGNQALLVASILFAALLAGCTAAEDESAAGSGIKIVSEPEDSMNDPYVFEATKNADAYTWDFGDGTKATGETVEHVFGVESGVFNVKLTTTRDGAKETHAPLRLELGSGENAAASFRLDLEWQWVQVGEDVTFSAAASEDPEGDRLLFNWFCSKSGPITLAGDDHGHPSVGTEFGGGSAATVPVSVLNGTDVPDPVREVDGDMCANINAGGFGDDGVVRGAFESAGIYELNLLAKDPANPSVSAQALVYVTDGARQSPWANETYSGQLQRSAPKEADPIAQELGQADHIETHSFEVRYPILGIRASISDDGGALTVSELEYEIRKGETSKWGPTSDDLERGTDFLKQGNHQLIVYLRQGAEVEYDVDIELIYQTDPMLLFEIAGGH